MTSPAIDNAKRNAPKIPYFALNEISGKYKTRRAIAPDQIIKAALKIAGERIKREHGPLSCPSDSKEYLTLALGTQEREVFVCLFLDNRHRVISYEELFFGTIDSAEIHPREVVRRALINNAAVLIIAHNHPSGILEPSAADRRITSRLRDALSLVDIRVLDHFIVGGNEAVSMAELGML